MFDFLLRNVRFGVKTDHKNQTFLKTAQSAKVRRWQLALEEFDFEYMHIKGEDNVVADAFSRLCDHHPMDGEANTEKLTEFSMPGDSIRSNAPTYVTNRDLIAIVENLSQRYHLLIQTFELK